MHYYEGKVPMVHLRCHEGETLVVTSARVFKNYPKNKTLWCICTKVQKVGPRPCSVTKPSEQRRRSLQWEQWREEEEEEEEEGYHKEEEEACRAFAIRYLYSSSPPCGTPPRLRMLRLE